MTGIPLNIPNMVTLFRLVLIPILIIAFLLPGYPYKPAILATIFFFASVSDLVDGYLARLLKQESAFGAFLDPVADKLTVATAMILLLYEHPNLLMLFPTLVIIGRELAISALREWMASLGAQDTVKVNFIGKLKTVSQLWAIGFLMYFVPIGTFKPSIIGYVLLYFATILTLWSMVVYLKAAWPSILGKQKL